jgi:hypothetical protein
VTKTEKAIIKASAMFGYEQRWPRGSLLWHLVNANRADKRAKKGVKK